MKIETISKRQGSERQGNASSAIKSMISSKKTSPRRPRRKYRSSSRIHPITNKSPQKSYSLFHQPSKLEKLWSRTWILAHWAPPSSTPELAWLAVRPSRALVLYQAKTSSHCLEKGLTYSSTTSRASLITAITLKSMCRVSTLSRSIWTQWQVARIWPTSVGLLWLTSSLCRGSDRGTGLRPYIAVNNSSHS